MKPYYAVLVSSDPDLPPMIAAHSNLHHPPQAFTLHEGGIDAHITHHLKVYIGNISPTARNALQNQKDILYVSISEKGVLLDETRVPLHTA